MAGNAVSAEDVFQKQQQANKSNEKQQHPPAALVLLLKPWAVLSIHANHHQYEYQDKQEGKNNLTRGEHIF